jgi:hypothetical protein
MLRSKSNEVERPEALDSDANMQNNQSMKI